MNNRILGEDIILPRSFWSPPHIRLSFFLIVGVDVLDDPRKIKIKAKISIENPF